MSPGERLDEHVVKARQDVLHLDHVLLFAALRAAPGLPVPPRSGLVAEGRGLLAVCRRRAREHVAAWVSCPAAAHAG